MPNYPSGQTYELLALRAAIRRDHAEQRDPKIRGTVGAGLAGVGLGGTLGVVANSAFNVPFAEMVNEAANRKSHGWFTPERHRELRRNMRTTFSQFVPSPGPEIATALPSAGQFRWNPAMRPYLAWNRARVRGPQFGPEMLAHEYGHLKFSRGLPGRVIQQARLANFAPGIRPVAGMVYPGNAMQMLALGSVGAAALADPDSAASKAAPWLAAGAMAPMLIDEGAATINGFRGLRAIGAPRGVLGKYALKNALGFGTYLTGAAVPVGAALLARHLKKKSKERRQAAFAT